MACDLDQAKKEAVTDATKRALKNFGSLLGLCLYEKSYTQEVVKIKVPPVRILLPHACAFLSRVAHSLPSLIGVCS